MHKQLAVSLKASLHVFWVTSDKKNNKQIKYPGPQQRTVPAALLPVISFGTSLPGFVSLITFCAWNKQLCPAELCPAWWVCTSLLATEIRLKISLRDNETRITSSSSYIPLPWESVKRAEESKEKASVSHTHFSVHIHLLAPNEPSAPPTNPILQHNWGISILLHILEQIPSLITDAFQSRHHYIFRPLSFKNVLKIFMPVPKGPLLLFCYALISLFLLLHAGGSTLLFIFCLFDLCVDGIHLAYPLFFTLLWRQAATVWCSY